MPGENMKNLIILWILGILILQTQANSCFDPCKDKVFSPSGTIYENKALVGKKYPITNYHCILKCALAITQATTLSNDVLLDNLDYCNRLWKSMWEEVDCDDAMKEFVRETFVSIIERFSSVRSYSLTAQLFLSLLNINVTYIYYTVLYNVIAFLRMWIDMNELTIMSMEILFLNLKTQPFLLMNSMLITKKKKI